MAKLNSILVSVKTMYFSWKKLADLLKTIQSELNDQLKIPDESIEKYFIINQFLALALRNHKNQVD